MSLNYIDIDLMNEYQKQKVKIKDEQSPKEENFGDKPPDENQENPNENIDDKKEGGGEDEQEDQGN